MSFKYFCLTILAAASLSGHALAAATKTKDTSASRLDGIQDITIPMYTGELQAKVEAEQLQRERANAPKTRFELGASSWKPTSVVSPSRINAGPFRAAAMPTLSASLFSPLARHLDLEFGLAFLAMRREGTISSAGLDIRQEQDAYITTVRAGLAYSPWAFWADRLRPYLSAAALPTMIVTRRSSFDDGINDTGVPFELGAGLLARVAKPVSLRLGVAQTLGKVRGSDMSGLAGYLGLRLPI